MPLTTVALLAAYTVIGITHIGARYTGAERIKIATKPILIPLLMSSLFIWEMQSGFTFAGIFMLVSLTLGWCGDIILIRQGNYALICGGLSFGIGHICTITAVISLIAAAPVLYPISILYSLALASVVIIGSYYALKDFHRSNAKILTSIGPYLITYICLLSLMFLSVAALREQYLSQATGLAGIGALSFYLSDWTLLRAEFKGTTNVYSSIWMLLYAFGQFALSFGIYSLSIQA